ncbi:hypothetical protein EDD86DRAFT_92039 [Gorgonomyces haynaldii]|nr:hypothetical protein EDD86DRAFT_92039 [Gorgonomyces haynaldii]
MHFWTFLDAFIWRWVPRVSQSDEPKSSTHFPYRMSFGLSTLASSYLPKSSHGKDESWLSTEALSEQYQKLSLAAGEYYKVAAEKGTEYYKVAAEKSGDYYQQAVGYIYGETEKDTEEEDRRLAKERGEHGGWVRVRKDVKYPERRSERDRYDRSDRAHERERRLERDGRGDTRNGSSMRSRSERRPERQRVQEVRRDQEHHREDRMRSRETKDYPREPQRTVESRPTSESSRSGGWASRGRSETVHSNDRLGSDRSRSLARSEQSSRSERYSDRSDSSYGSQRSDSSRLSSRSDSSRSTRSMQRPSRSETTRESTRSTSRAPRSRY